MTYRYEIRIADVINGTFRSDAVVKHAMSLDNARKVGRQQIEDGARFAEIFEARKGGWMPYPRGRIERFEGKITYQTREMSMTILYREVKKDGSLGGIVYGYGQKLMMPGYAKRRGTIKKR